MSLDGELLFLVCSSPIVDEISINNNNQKQNIIYKVYFIKYLKYTEEVETI